MTRRTFGQIVAGVAAGLVAGVTPFLMRLWRAPRMWTIGPGDGWPRGFRDGDSIDILKGACACIPEGVHVETVIVGGRLDSSGPYGRPCTFSTMLLETGHSIGGPCCNTPLWRFSA